MLASRVCQDHVVGLQSQPDERSMHRVMTLSDKPSSQGRWQRHIDEKLHLASSTVSSSASQAAYLSASSISPGKIGIRFQDGFSGLTGSQEAKQARDWKPKPSNTRFSRAYLRVNCDAFQLHEFPPFGRIIASGRQSDCCTIPLKGENGVTERLPGKEIEHAL